MSTTAQAGKEKTKTEKPKKGVVTKRPANLAKAQRQPPAGQMPTAAMVKRGREEYGITPSITTDKWVAIRPASRGFIVHAATSKDAEHTLCTTPTNWTGGVKVVEDKSEMNCLWCQTRIASFGK